MLEAKDVVTLPLEDLISDPDNARTHSARNIEAIKNSLENFGQVEPLVVQKKTKRVIGGNGRVEAMRALGWKTVACVLLDVDTKKAKALGIALNRTGELAEWNFGTLEKLLADIVNDYDSLALGFAPGELDALIQPVQKNNFDFPLYEDNEPEENEIKPGKRARCPNCQVEF